MANSISTLSSALTSIGFNYNAAAALVQANISATPFSGNPRGGTSYIKGTAAIGAVNAIVCNLQNLAASGTVTLNLNSITDVGAGTLNFTRIKGWFFALLSLTQGVIDAVKGTSCTSITIGAAATPFLFNMAGTTPTMNLNNGAAWMYDEPSAAGLLTSGANNVKILNNDGTNQANILYAFWGADA